MVNFESPADCLEFLVSQHGEEWWQQIVFRGEHSLHASRLPSAARSPQDDYQRYISYAQGLGMHLGDTVFYPRLGSSSYAPLLDGKPLECPDLLGVSTGEGYAQLNWRLESIFQHYGLHTHWIDLTFDPRVALFFGSWNARANRITTEGEGYIYYASIDALSTSGGGPLIDLQESSDILAKILGVTAERPRAQAAASFRCPIDLDSVVKMSETFQCVSFRRSEDLGLLSEKWLFPEEPLQNIVAEWDRDYMNYLRDSPELNRIWEEHPENAVVAN